MVQFATPVGKKDKPDKPKKELGKVYDVAQVVLPIVAGVVGTPLAGAAVAALMQGVETKYEGGSYMDALKSGALSGGISAVTGGIAGGIGGGASSAVAQGAKEVGKGAVVEAGLKELATEGVKQGGAFSLGLGVDQAGNLVKDAAISKAMATVGDELAKDSIAQIASSTAAGSAAGIGMSGKKEAFINEIGNLAEGGLGVHEEVVAESQGKKRMAEMLNNKYLQSIQNAPQGEFVKPKSRHYSGRGGSYTPYGG